MKAGTEPSGRVPGLAGVRESPCHPHPGLGATPRVGPPWLCPVLPPLHQEDSLQNSASCEQRGAGGTCVPRPGTSGSSCSQRSFDWLRRQPRRPVRCPAPRGAINTRSLILRSLPRSVEPLTERKQALPASALSQGRPLTGGPAYAPPEPSALPGTSRTSVPAGSQALGSNPCSASPFPQMQREGAGEVGPQAPSWHHIVGLCSYPERTAPGRLQRDGA